MLKWLFPKKEPLLTEEDMKKLRGIERVAYMKEAERLAYEKGRNRAKKEFDESQNKRKRPNPWP